MRGRLGPGSFGAGQPAAEVSKRYARNAFPGANDALARAMKPWTWRLPGGTFGIGNARVRGTRRGCDASCTTRRTKMPDEALPNAVKSKKTKRLGAPRRTRASLGARGPRAVESLAFAGGDP